MKKVQLLFLSSLLIFITGCASNQAKSHLKLKEIDEGLALTSKELKEDPNDAYLNYYHGRFLSSKKQYEEAIKHFKIASESFPYKTFHKFWLGVAYGKNKEYDKEREIYQKILEEKNGRYKNALVYLGKNYYRTKQYDKAIETFEKAHEMYRKPHSYMYYYYAASLLKKGKKEEAKKYFSDYLKKYPTYSLTRSAAYRLNTMGDFTYSSFKIGEDIVTIKNMDYLTNSNTLEHYSKQALKTIAEKIKENKNLTLYIVSYDNEDLKRAELRVKNIKKYFLSEFPEIEFSDIKIAWLKNKKKIKVGKKSFTQDKYVHFFTKNKKG